MNSTITPVSYSSLNSISNAPVNENIKKDETKSAFMSSLKDVKNTDEKPHSNKTIWKRCCNVFRVFHHLHSLFTTKKPVSDTGTEAPKNNANILNKNTVPSSDKVSSRPLPPPPPPLPNKLLSEPFTPGTAKNGEASRPLPPPPPPLPGKIASEPVTQGTAKNGGASRPLPPPPPPLPTGMLSTPSVQKATSNEEPSTLANLISNAQLRRTEGKTEVKPEEAFVNELKAKLAGRNNTALKPQQETNKFALEIAALKAQDLSEVEKRAEAEAKNDARIAVLLEAEAQAEKLAKQQAENKKEAELKLAANIKRDAKGIPFPPPLPPAPMSSPVNVSQNKPDHAKDASASVKDNKSIIDDHKESARRISDEILKGNFKLRKTETNAHKVTFESGLESIMKKSPLFEKIINSQE